MRQSRKMKIWGLGLFLTLLLFTTVFSQEQSDEAGASGVAVETAVGDPSTIPSEQPSTATPGASNASSATLGQSNRPTSIPELTAQKPFMLSGMLC